jgi:hypothetical protein
MSLLQQLAADQPAASVLTDNDAQNIHSRYDCSHLAVEHICALKLHFDVTTFGGEVVTVLLAVRSVSMSERKRTTPPAWQHAECALFTAPSAVLLSAGC